MKKIYIHDRSQLFKSNGKPLAVLYDGKITVGREVSIHGPSKLVFDPDHALKTPDDKSIRAWIETEAKVTVR